MVVIATNVKVLCAVGDFGNGTFNLPQKLDSSSNAQLTTSAPIAQNTCYGLPFQDNALGGLCKTQIYIMSDFISRLSDEKSQLDEKIAKLEAFTKSDAFNSIDNVQRGLLKIQLNAMATYSQILDERLWRLSPSESVS